MPDACAYPALEGTFQFCDIMSHYGIFLNLFFLQSMIFLRKWSPQKGEKLTISKKSLPIT